MKDDQTALFTVVDRDDRIIGYRTRYDCHHDKSLIHRAAIVVLFDKKGRVLLQKRSALKDLYPGYFTVSASGHVDKGETYHQAALREVQEELGITKRLRLTHIDTYLVKTDAETEMNALFRGTWNGSLNTANDEVESVLYADQKKLAEIKNTLTPCALASFYKLGLL